MDLGLVYTHLQLVLEEGEEEARRGGGERERERERGEIYSHSFFTCANCDSNIICLSGKPFVCLSC
jgi:hypothetical protein